MSETLDRLVGELSRLPGVGRKTAQRLAMHLLKAGADEVYALADSLRGLKERTRYCTLCNNVTESELCPICASPKRDRSRILVVEEISDLMAVEATHEYRGLYHVLLGAISPIDGIGPDDTKVDGLIRRVKAGGVEEVILATNPNLKGEATALYITGVLRPFGVKTTRIAYGLPMGGHLEYVDAGTLAKSLEGRREVG
ncbi:MAG TPA: recombination mediator RecR [Nitrospirota bacterium]